MQLLLADMINILENMAPPSLAESWDNVGLQIGDPCRPVNSVWVALDPGPDVVTAACRSHIDLLITHHPLFFRPVKRIETHTPLGTVIDLAVRHGLAVYSLHTNLDAAADGLNELLAHRLGLSRLRPLVPSPDPLDGHHCGIGRIGVLRRAMRLCDLARGAKDRLGAAAVRMAGDPRLRVKHVAVVTGSGGNLVADFLNSEAEAFISGDLRYHGVREIEYARRGAVDIGHFHSEHLMAETLTQRLQRTFERRRVEVRVQACPLERDPFTVL